MKRNQAYYDLNIQVWQESEEFYYSVVQEFREDGKDNEVLVWGSADLMEDAITAVREAVMDVLE